MQRQRQNKVRKPMKTRRSLKKHKSEPKTSDSAQNNAINVDLENDLSAILQDFNNGNPEQSIARVYALAIEAIAQSITDGLSALCDQLLNASTQNDLSDHPLAPWLNALRPKSQQEVDLLRSAISQKLDQTKESIIQSIKKQTSVPSVPLQPLRDLPLSPDAKFPPFSHQLSAQRLEDLRHIISLPSDETQNAPRKYRIQQTGGTYRFSIGTQKSSDATAPSKDKKEDDNKLQDNDDNGSQNINHTSPDVANHCPEKIDDIIEDPLPDQPAPIEINAPAQDHSDLPPVNDIERAGNEIVGVMHEMALQLTDAVLSAYAAETQSSQKLSDILSDDPRLKDDRDFSEFIDILDEDDEQDDDCDSIDNDELANALSLILRDIDEES